MASSSKVRGPGAGVPWTHGIVSYLDAIPEGKQRAESASVVHILESEAWDIGKPNRADEGEVTNNHIESQIVTGWFQRFFLDQRDRGWFNAVGVSFTILRNSWEVLR